MRLLRALCGKKAEPQVRKVGAENRREQLTCFNDLFEQLYFPRQQRLSKIKHADVKSGSRQRAALIPPSQVIWYSPGPLTCRISARTNWPRAQQVRFLSTDYTD